MSAWGSRQEIFNGRRLVSDPLEVELTGNLPVWLALPADQMPEGVPDAAAHPFVVYAVVVAAVAYVLATAVAKVAEPISSALARIREHRQASEDARIRDLSSQVDHLLGEVAVLRERLTALDRHLSAHAAWDRRVLTAAISAGVDPAELGPAPPLWPVID